MLGRRQDWSPSSPQWWWYLPDEFIASKRYHMEEAESAWDGQEIERKQNDKHFEDEPGQGCARLYAENLWRKAVLNAQKITRDKNVSDKCHGWDIEVRSVDVIPGRDRLIWVVTTRPFLKQWVSEGITVVMKDYNRTNDWPYGWTETKSVAASSGHRKCRQRNSTSAKCLNKMNITEEKEDIH